MLTILAFFLILTVVVLAHELGHLLAAKRSGIGVLEFGLGLGPKLFGFKHKDTLYSVHLFPIGGFVNLAGIDDENEKFVPPELDFNKKPLKNRFLTIFWGPLANLILAWAIYWLIFWVAGVPVGLKNEIASIKPGSPAEKAGLKIGDIIYALEDSKIEEMEKAIDFIHNWPPGKPLKVTLKRGNETFDMIITPEFDNKLKISFLGFTPQIKLKKYGFFPAIFLGLKQTFVVIVGVFYGLYLLFTGRVGLQGLAGPLGIAQFTGQALQAGGISFLNFIAFISVNLSIINLLPIPALDGGRIIFLIIEFFRGKPLPPEKEKYFHLVGFVFLISLVILLTFFDIKRILISKGILIK